MHTLYTIHGNGLSPQIFSALNVRNVRLKQLVIPGHAGRPLNAPTSFSQMVAQLATEIDQSEDFSLLGFSLGGHFAHQLLQHVRPKSVISLAAAPLSPTTIGEAFIPSPILGYLFTKDLSTSQKIDLANSFFSLHPERTYEIVAMLDQCDPCFRETLGLDVQNQRLADEVELLKPYRDQSLFVFAQDDVLLNKDYIKSLNLKNIHWTKGGHLLLWEDPEALNTLLNQHFS